jgi:glycosyltransferase involved in cell wall biosynthesis
MKIAIDAKWFYQGPPSGHIVVRKLVEKLIDQGDGHQIYIILNKNDQSKTFPFQQQNVHLIYVWGGNNLLSNVFLLPFTLFKYQLDLVIFQNFIPIISNFKRISFIYDLIFLTKPEYFTLKERIYLNPLTLLSRRSHRICTISGSEKARIAKYLPNKTDKIDVVYMGISSAFRPREFHDQALVDEVIAKYKLPERFILYVGRLNVRKNIKNLILALPRVHNKEIQLVIAGPHDTGTLNVQELTRELGVQDKVHVTGFIDGEHLPILYSLATIFCFPSFEEGFGLPPLESMASGVPAIVSNCSSLPEVCGVAGIYIDPNSPESIAAAVDGLLDDAVYYQSMRELGLDWVKRFTWESSASSLLKSAMRAVED